MTAAARAPGGGGSGQTQMQNPAQSGGRASPAITAQAPRQAVLHLRGATREEEREQEGESERRGITWAEDVVDNEGMGRKSSKVCCIYHAPKGIDESSDESSSDSSSDSDSGDDGSARPVRKQGGGHGHGHSHGSGKGKGRARSPNAYEKVRKPKSEGAKDKG